MYKINHDPPTHTHKKKKKETVQGKAVMSSDRERGLPGQVGVL